MNISRRTFLQHTGTLAGGVLLGATNASTAAPSSGDLPRRVLGKTGQNLTVLTLGTAPCGFARPASPKNVADCVNAAIDLGINSIDTAPAYDVAEEGVGLGLGSRRKDVFLATKVWADTIPDAEKTLSRSLKRLKTDCLDLVYFHCLGERKVDVAMDPDGVYTWLLKQKKAGKTRFVGVSGHNRPGRFARFLNSGECDVLLIVVNFVDCNTYHFERDVLPLAEKNGIGIVAMKVFGGSQGMNYARPDCPPQLDAKHLDLAVRYAMGVHGVATLNIGVHNVEQLRKNVELIKNYRPLSPEEQTRCAALGKELAAKWGEHFGPAAEPKQ
jgi:predicted aldo/keto reductase-like oxidoreductase